MIADFTTDEIEAVLAHEMGHQVHKDIPILIAFSTLIEPVGLYLAFLAMNWSAGYFLFSGSGDIAGLPGDFNPVISGTQEIQHHNDLYPHL